MPTTFNQAVSVADTLTEPCEKVKGLSEVESRRKQEFARGGHSRARAECVQPLLWGLMTLQIYARDGAVG